MGSKLHLTTTYFNQNGVWWIYEAWFMLIKVRWMVLLDPKQRLLKTNGRRWEWIWKNSSGAMYLLGGSGRRHLIGNILGESIWEEASGTRMLRWDPLAEVPWLRSFGWNRLAYCISQLTQWWNASCTFYYNALKCDGLQFRQVTSDLQRSRLTNVMDCAH